MEVEALTVERRESFGKRRNKRLRAAGKIPAILYGHKQENISLTLSEDEILAALRRGSRFVQLKGAINEKALIKECQWDTWGQEVYHVDFARVSEHEKIKVDVQLELRGEAPGVREAGVVKHLLHNIELECEAASVPDRLEVNINQLELNQIIYVSDLELPPGAKALTDPTQIVVSCLPAVEVEEKDEQAGENEPEVIGRKKSDEEDSE